MAAIVWGRRLRLFPLNEVRVKRLREIQRSELEQSLAGSCAATFHRRHRSVAPGAAAVPWVRRAELCRRKWPGRIELRIEEHQAAAHWGDRSGQLVNTYGEIFAASLTGSSRCRV